MVIPSKIGSVLLCLKFGIVLASRAFSLVEVSAVVLFNELSK